MYGMWAHSRLFIRYVKGYLSQLEKQVLIPPFSELCKKEGIRHHCPGSSWPRGRTCTAVYWQSLTSYSRYRKAVTGILQDVNKMQKLPILPSLLVADERGSMKRPQLAEKGIITVENVEEKTAKIIRTCAPRQHKDKVYDMLLPMAKGTIDMYTVTIKGSTLTTWDKWNLKRLGQVGQAAIQVENIQEKRRCVDKQIKFMVTTLMWNPKLLCFSVCHRRPVGGLNCVQLRGVQLRARQEEEGWEALWKTKSPIVIQEFISTLLWGKWQWQTEAPWTDKRGCCTLTLRPVQLLVSSGGSLRGNWFYCISSHA